MKRLKLFIPLSIFVLLCALLYRGLSLDPNEMPSALIDKPIPDFSLPSLRAPDRLVTRDDLLGQVALINVWATWCPSCVVEHPFLVELAREQGIPIFGVDYKDDRDEAIQWLTRLGDPYVLNIFDEAGKLGIDLGVFGAPETYVIDHLGIIRYKHVGVVNERVWRDRLLPVISELRTAANG